MVKLKLRLGSLASGAASTVGADSASNAEQNRGVGLIDKTNTRHG